MGLISDKMKKGSKNRSKQRVKVAFIHETTANQRKDFLHKAIARDRNNKVNDYMSKAARKLIDYCIA